MLYEMAFVSTETKNWNQSLWKLEIRKVKKLS